MRRPIALSVLALLLVAAGPGCGPSGSGPVDAGHPEDGAAGDDVRRADDAPQWGQDASTEDAAADAAVQQDTAPQQDAKYDAYPPVGCYSLLINEFQVQGATDNDEFIEIAGPVGGDISTIKVVYREGAASTDTLLYAFSTGDQIPGSGYVIVASSGWLGGDAGGTPRTYLATTARNLSKTGGGIALRQGVPDTGTVVDSVGYGTATNVFVQGTATGAPPANKSSSRSPRCKNTGNNASDFSLSNPTPGW